MPNLPNHVMQQLQAMGLTNAEIQQIQMNGSLTKTQPNGATTHVTVDDNGNVSMNQSDMLSFSITGTGEGMQNSLSMLSPDQQAKVREGMQQVEKMLGADLDGDGMVGPPGEAPSDTPTAQTFVSDHEWSGSTEPPHAGPAISHTEPTPSTNTLGTGSPFGSQQKRSAGSLGTFIALALLAGAIYFAWKMLL